MLNEQFKNVLDGYRTSVLDYGDIPEIDNAHGRTKVWLHLKPQKGSYKTVEMVYFVYVLPQYFFKKGKI